MKKLLFILTLIISAVSSVAVAHVAGNLWLSVPLVAGGLILGYHYRNQRLLYTSCATISADLAVDCNNPLVAGVNDRMIIFNFDDKDSESFNANPLIMESLTLATGAVGYEYSGINNSHEPSFKP